MKIIFSNVHCGFAQVGETTWHALASLQRLKLFVMESVSGLRSTPSSSTKSEDEHRSRERGTEEDPPQAATSTPRGSYEKYQGERAVCERANQYQVYMRGPRGMV